MFEFLKSRPIPLIAGLVAGLAVLIFGRGLFRSSNAQPAPVKDFTSEGRYDFNKAVSEGLAFVYEGKAEMRNGRIKIGTQEGFMDFQDVFRIETVHLKVEGGLVIKARRKYLKGEKTARIQMGEQVQPEFEIDPLFGETVETEVVGNEVRLTLVGKKPNDKQSPLLRPQPIHPQLKWFPDEPISVGKKWNVEANKVTDYPDLMDIVEGGTWTRHFRKIESIDNEPCAEIFDELDVFGKSVVPAGEKKVSFKGTVTNWRSLKTNLVRKEIFEGTTTSDGPLPNGLPFWMSGKLKTHATRNFK